MADNSIRVEVRGLDKLLPKMEKIGDKLNVTLQNAALESERTILDTEGLRKYPPETAANREPYPFYERGRGTWTRPGYNTGKSERYGTKWTTKRINYGAIIGNSASYAKYLGGEEQNRVMAAYGWRRLFDVAREKKDEIQKVFQGWVNRLLKELDLL